jgi:hypothetical protein
MSVEVVERFDGETMARVPFGRSRALGTLSVALFGLATRMLTPRPVLAAHGPVPSPCFGFGQCHCCNGDNCCQNKCKYKKYLGCPSTGQCWYSCGPGPQGFGLYHCCDFSSPDGPCICSKKRANAC